MASWKRQLHLWHRWLGIALGLLVLMWFGSGIVMMYVPYPSLTEQERMAWLAPLDARQVRVDAWHAWQALQVTRPVAAGSAPALEVPDEVRLTNVAGRPAYHFKVADRWQSVWADNGQPLRVTPALAMDSARSAAPGARIMSAELIDIDQWSFGRLQDHRPLYRVSADDAAGSLLYISSRSGELVRDTTRSERAWNWAGSVIHWIYFTPLRTHGQPWRQVVMWTSGAALLLVMLGMVLGIQRLRLRRRRRYAGGRRSPYRGWQAWHHWLGLGAGAVMMTWLFSGWLSVTPFDWLASPGVTARDRLAFAGGPLNRNDLDLPLAAILARHADVLELEWRRVDGQLYLSALGRTQRRLLDGRSGAVTAPDAAHLHNAIRALRPGAPLAVETLTSEDHYHYSHHNSAVLPVLRARFALVDEVTFYIDPAQAQLVGYADRHSRWNRWLFNGLHQLDVVRARPAWDALVIMLCLLGGLATLAGVVLGARRLAKRPAGQRRPGAR